jgi:hypothetical protein
MPELTSVEKPHVPTAILYDAAEGTRNLYPEERKHLHLCDYCQLILRSFLTRVVGTAQESSPRPNRKPAA